MHALRVQQQTDIDDLQNGSRDWAERHLTSHSMMLSAYGLLESHTSNACRMALSTVTNAAPEAGDVSPLLCSCRLPAADVFLLAAASWRVASG